MDQTFMKEKKILPLVLSMALPMIISMAVNSLYNIIDSFFVAKVSENAMTALSLVYPIQNLVNSIAVGFGVGINAVVAFHLGAGEMQNADRATTYGLFLSFIHGLILTVFSIFGMPYFVKMFTTDTDVINLAVMYSTIAFSFSTIVNVGIAFEKIFQAVGRMNVSMISMICGCVTNIILDPIMIFGLGSFPAMGIQGAALATGIGQTITLIIYFIFYFASPIQAKFRISLLKSGKRLLKRLYSIGVPAMLNMALPSLLITALNGILSEFSGSYVLVLGVYYKLQTFIYLTANGLIQGIRPIIGYNCGAGEHKRVKQIYNTALLLSAIIMALGTALSWIMPSTLFGMFTANPDTLKLGVTALNIISIGFIVSAVSVTSSGALEGLGKGLPSLWISLFRYIIIIIPAAFVFSRFFGAVGVWISFPFAEFVTAVFAYFIYHKASRRI